MMLITIYAFSSVFWDSSLEIIGRPVVTAVQIATLSAWLIVCVLILKIHIFIIVFVSFFICFFAFVTIVDGAFPSLLVDPTHAAIALVIITAVAALFGFLAIRLYKYSEKRSKSPLYFLILIGFSLMLPIIIQAQSLFPEFGNVFGMLLFLVVFPIINGLFDWASLGFTRFALSQSFECWEKNRRLLGIIWAVLDVVAAILLFFILALALKYYIIIMNVMGEYSGAAQPSFDLDGLLSRLRDPNTELTTKFVQDGWVFFMMMTALLPSLIHVVAMGFALTGMITPLARLEIYAKIMKAPKQASAKEKQSVATYLALNPLFEILISALSSLVMIAGFYFLIKWIAAPIIPFILFI